MDHLNDTRANDIALLYHSSGSIVKFGNRDSQPLAPGQGGKAPIYCAYFKLIQRSHGVSGEEERYRILRSAHQDCHRPEKLRNESREQFENVTVNCVIPIGQTQTINHLYQRE